MSDKFDVLARKLIDGIKDSSMWTEDVIVLAAHLRAVDGEARSQEAEKIKALRESVAKLLDRHNCRTVSDPTLCEVCKFGRDHAIKPASMVEPPSSVAESKPDQARERQWEIRFDCLEGMIEIRDSKLARCRFLVDKILGGEKIERSEWNFLGNLPKENRP